MMTPKIIQTGLFKHKDLGIKQSIITPVNEAWKILYPSEKGWWKSSDIMTQNAPNYHYYDSGKRHKNGEILFYFCQKEIYKEVGEAVKALADAPYYYKDGILGDIPMGGTLTGNGRITYWFDLEHYWAAILGEENMIRYRKRVRYMYYGYEK